MYDPAAQIGVGIEPGVTQAVSAASGVWGVRSGQLVADQLARWKLTKGQVKHASGLNNAHRATERWLAPIKPHRQHLAAASSVGTSLVANLKHITVTLATWDAVWEVYKDPKWAQQRLGLYGAQDRALEKFFKKLEEDMAAVSMKRHGRAKQLVVFFGAAGIGTGGAWGADAVLRACWKVPSCSSQEASQPAASEPGPSTPLPAKRSKRTEAEQAIEPTQPTKGTGKAQGKAAKAKPAPQPGRWVDRDCNPALNMQRIGESRWRPLELCWWPEQGKLPAKGKEYPGLGQDLLQQRLLLPLQGRDLLLSEHCIRHIHLEGRRREQHCAQLHKYGRAMNLKCSLAHWYAGQQLQRCEAPQGAPAVASTTAGCPPCSLLNSNKKEQARDPGRLSSHAGCCLEPARLKVLLELLVPFWKCPLRCPLRCPFGSTTQPTKGTGKAQGKAAKAKPAPQPGRWLDRDCNAALNMQRIGESRWRPLELCW
ncbi:hypothetical protein QJQ45_009934 [Haematococcus lacustris]|nr:hypothetical protein QJQ45_009934 [Haematococcus lacustris]